MKDCAGSSDVIEDEDDEDPPIVLAMVPFSDCFQYSGSKKTQPQLV